MNIDDLTIQRCLDGELTEQEQIQLIRALDNEPTLDGWRRLAIEYLEDQLFRSAITSDAFLRDDDTPPMSETDPSAVTPLQSPPPKTVHWDQFEAPSATNRRNPSRPFPLIAASLLAGVIFGGSSVHFGLLDGTQPQIVESGLEGEYQFPNETAQPGRTQSADPRESFNGQKQLTQQNANFFSGGQNSRGVPVYPVNGVPSEWLRSLEQHGFEIDDRPRDRWGRLQNSPNQGSQGPGFFVRPAVQ